MITLHAPASVHLFRIEHHQLCLLVMQVSTWKFCTLHIPELCCTLKSAEYERVRQMESIQWSALNALGLAASRFGTAVEERTQQLATLKGTLWLDASL